MWGEGVLSDARWSHFRLLLPNFKRFRFVPEGIAGSSKSDTYLMLVLGTAAHSEYIILVIRNGAQVRVRDHDEIPWRCFIDDINIITINMLNKPFVENENRYHTIRRPQIKVKGALPTLS
jgi:hypothetical protein